MESTMQTNSCGAHQCYCGNCRKPISWGAILAGALVSIGLSFLLNLFCMSIGLTMVSVTDQGQATLAIGGFIALLIGVFIVMFVSGTTAGYMAKEYCASKKIGAFYGFTAWCLALLITMLLAIHAGRMIPDYRHFVSVKTPTVEIQSKNTTKAAADIRVNVDEESTNYLGFVSLLIFTLFFVGALAATWGGCMGVCCHSKCRENKNHPL